MCPSAAEGALVSPTMLVPSCPSQACFWVLVVCVSCQCQFWVSKYQICLLEVLETQLDMSAVPLKDPILVSILRLIILEAEIFG